MVENVKSPPWDSESIAAITPNYLSSGKIPETVPQKNLQTLLYSGTSNRTHHVK